MATSIENNIRLTMPDQQLAPTRKISCANLTRASFAHTSSAKASPISSRASQNAAALLVDLGTVDIR
jgi:hypothetical protein